MVTASTNQLLPWENISLPLCLIDPDTLSVAASLVGSFSLEAPGREKIFPHRVQFLRLRYLFLSGPPVCTPLLSLLRAFLSFPLSKSLLVLFLMVHLVSNLVQILPSLGR